MEAGKGQRRGKPYNFAKPQAPHSKPQPCAAKLRFLESKALSFDKSNFANPARLSDFIEEEIRKGIEGDLIVLSPHLFGFMIANLEYN